MATRTQSRRRFLGASAGTVFAFSLGTREVLATGHETIRLGTQASVPDMTAITLTVREFYPTETSPNNTQTINVEDGNNLYELDQLSPQEGSNFYELLVEMETQDDSITPRLDRANIQVSFEISNLPSLPLSQKISTVAYNPVFLIIGLASLVGGYIVGQVKNSWGGIILFNFIIISGYMIDYVPLGVVFISVLISVATGLALRGIDRKDDIEINLPSPSDGFRRD